MTRNLTLALLCIGSSFTSCQKERIEEHPEYIGEWITDIPGTREETETRIWINEDGTASYLWEKSAGRKKVIVAEQSRSGKFAIRDGYLCIGSNKFEIDQAPLKLRVPDGGWGDDSHYMKIEGVGFTAQKLDKIPASEFYSDYEGSWAGNWNEYRVTLSVNSGSTTPFELVYRNENDSSIHEVNYIQGDRFYLQKFDSSTYDTQFWLVADAETTHVRLASSEYYIERLNLHKSDSGLIVYYGDQRLNSAVDITLTPL